MKHILWLVLLCGCSEPNVSIKKTDDIVVIKGQDVTWIEFEKDGHTYIWLRQYSVGGLEHHPDCKCQMKPERD